jgi:hypothetical protein
MPMSRNIDTTGVWAHPSTRTNAMTEYLRDIFLSKSMEGLLSTACARRMFPSASDPVCIARGQRCL